MLFHFLIIQAHLQHVHLFFHRALGLTSYICNKWSSKIMNVFKHSFDLCSWLTDYSQGKWGRIPPNMPFSPSSSHLAFLPKSCFHSCILLLMFTLCGPFLIRKQKKHPDFLSYCNLRLLGIYRPSDLLLVSPFLSSLDMNLLDGCRTSGACDWGMEQVLTLVLSSRYVYIAVQTLWLNPQISETICSF